MTNAGVSVSPAGLACTLSQTPNNLQYEALDVLYMYSALGLVPSALCSTAWGFLGFIVGGLQGVGTAATLGFPLIGASSFLLTRQMVRYGASNPCHVVLLEPEQARDLQGRSLHSACVAK